ncbi:MAG: Mov34/MPN/PAD-1 family protein [Polyangiaceae bacterium]|nr:Mov34/MPN/PAD-1 family protein [Polyangiaceae bacterium]
MVTPADHPWTAGGIRIARSALRGVEDDALAGYARGEEACGYLRGPAGDPLLCDEHFRMENVANKLHAIDPERYFRTGRTYFEFNGVKFERALSSSRAEGRPVKVLYHSHLDAGAYFSPTDAAAMSQGKMPEAEGGPIEMGPGPPWPLAFLVTSVRGGSIAEHGLFVWDAGTKSFVRSAHTVVDV